MCWCFIWALHSELCRLRVWRPAMLHEDFLERNGEIWNQQQDNGRIPLPCSLESCSKRCTQMRILQSYDLYVEPEAARRVFCEFCDFEFADRVVISPGYFSKTKRHGRWLFFFALSQKDHPLPDPMNILPRLVSYRALVVANSSCLHRISSRDL